MKKAFFTIVFLILLGGGAIALQIFLSRRENRWFGLIMPILTFLISLIYVLNVADVGDTTSTVMTIISVFLFANIPTAVFIVIYFACRERYKRKRNLDKMKSQDL
jgi:cell division protein FtsW (lipid II flippase)